MTALVWIRRDLRLDDNPALAAPSGPVIPVFILDPETENWGAAALWRLGQGLNAFVRALEARGSRLILRRGPALQVLQALIGETGAGQVHWNRAHDPGARVRDRGVKAGLAGAVSHPANLIAEPWTLKTATGGPYRVFTPFWRVLRARGARSPCAAPALHAPDHWPQSEDLASWGLGAGVRQGAASLAAHASTGEAAAAARSAAFLDKGLAFYARDRDRIDRDGGSGLSEHLAFGEISVARLWHAARAAMEAGNPGAERFLAELAWRDFAAHLHDHAPDLDRAAWRAGWDGFPWQGDHEGAAAWRQGATGADLVDAAMRQLWVTGRMHNRLRMVAASYLTKNLLTDWRVGLRWFADCLTDWDASSNAMGWQWVAGCGPDAAPYFRIFNPATQAERFDPQGEFRDFWLKGEGAGAFAAARPPSWPGTRPDGPVPPLALGRARALEAFSRFSAQIRLHEGKNGRKFPPGENESRGG